MLLVRPRNFQYPLLVNRILYISFLKSKAVQVYIKNLNVTHSVFDIHFFYMI